MIARIKNKLRALRVRFLRLRTRRCPLIRISGGTCLIIAPHPDDEVLGCGGLIQRLCRQGTPPHVVILTGGEKSHAFCCHTKESLIKEERRNLAVKILSDLELPAENLYLLNFPDGSISLKNAEMGQLENLLQQIAPQHIFIPHHGEGWPDHLAVKKMIKSIPGTSRAELYEYCVWLWYYNKWNLDWKNAFLLSMTSKEYQTKEEAIHHYISTLAPCGNPWSGILPAILTNARLWHKELFFLIK